ncbi:MAG: hypothetical protein LQ350_008018 [Teloschistes chrysophthalmus]|nr:MAG: hypothetical protein LQ350_008018 [Niorma chrysophthalma]
MRDLELMIQQIFDTSSRAKDRCPNRELDEVRTTLHRVTSWVLNQPKILASSQYDRTVVRRELKAYYLGQIRSIFESSSLAASRKGAASQPKHPQETYHKWAHTTSADHVAGLIAFPFFCCLLNPNDEVQDCFPGAEAKYLAHDLSLHLASLCRMENDIGSIERDRREHNLNSIDCGA